VKSIFAGVIAVAFSSAPALAQNHGIAVDDAAYVTCQEAQAMSRDDRVALALAIVERASAHYGVPYVEGTTFDGQIGTMLRSGCTVFPEAYVQTIATMAVRRAARNVAASPAPTPPMPFEKAIYVTCQQYEQLSESQKDTMNHDLAVHAGQHYGMRFGDTPSDQAKLGEGLRPLIQGTCALVPDLYVYAVVSRAVQAAADRARTTQ
jgi:hypothetical protein